MPPNEIADHFPGLDVDGYRITSPQTPLYNCIAWAAGETHRWWWPDPDLFYYWPADLPRVETIESFIQAFTAMGFALCDGEEYEEGFEKIALYMNEVGLPAHASRQLPTGRWTSKLGMMEDIEHGLAGLEGENYGRATIFLKREINDNRE